MRDRNYLINGDPLRSVLIFAWPIIAGNLFQQFYNLADAAIVGRYVGETALAAVGACYALTNVFICAASGGANGAAVIVSRHFGAARYRDMKTAFYTAVVAFLALSAFLGAFGAAFCRAIMGALNTPPDAIGMAVSYLRVYFFGLPFLFMYNVMSSMFNALGRSGYPLFFLIFSSVLNVGLDLWMVRGLSMGIAGAAWATLISQGVSAALSSAVFLRGLRSFECERPKAFDAFELSDMTRVALPSILQQSSVTIGMLLVQSVVNSFGSAALAGYSSSMRVECICTVPFYGVGAAMTSYTAQNLGAGRPERVRNGVAAGFVILAVSCSLIFAAAHLFAPQMIGIFNDDPSAEALSVGVTSIKWQSCFFIILGIKMLFDGLLRGAGDMFIFTLASLINLLIRVSLSVVLAPRLGIFVVWRVASLGWTVNAVMVIAQYMTGRWKTVFEQKRGRAAA